MNLRKWYQKRGQLFIIKRGARLLERYQLSPGKAMRRIQGCVKNLSELGCSPTFPTPGNLVARYPGFFRDLQSQGVEIAVHGYHHVDLSEYPVEQARQQLIKTEQVFRQNGIEAQGFRCPYLGFRQEISDSLPAGLFHYSSNQAIRLDSSHPDEVQQGGIIFNTVDKFYKASDSTRSVCVPRQIGNLVEIPVCIPDDLQIIDGLQTGPAGISQTWRRMLSQVYQRGELFNLLFHTELAAQCEQGFSDLLKAAHEYKLPVWVARLQDISEWWEEKSKFSVETVLGENSKTLIFNCSTRATILVKGDVLSNIGEVWDENYRRIHTQSIDLPGDLLPFVGICDEIPPTITSFLKEQGYLVETGDKASKCTIRINQDVLSGISNEVQLINYLESNEAPQVRFWHWPDGARCALSVSGDLDALSLQDYASRFFIR